MTRTLDRSGLLALALIAAALGCATSGSAVTPQTRAEIHHDALMAHASVLAADSMEGRLMSTAGNARAREYLVRALTAAGLQPFGSSLEMPAEALGPRDTVARRGVNVVGQVRGTVNPERYIVVSAHYDHVGVRNGEIYNGADDNASGTAALIELARWFRNNPPSHSIIFVAFDGEEVGMIGSRAFVAAPPVPVERIVLNVNLDMVGRNDQRELYASGTHHYPFLKPYLDSVATRAPVSLRFGHDDPASGPRDDWTLLSDHASFHRAGIPFVYFGVEDHPDYHRPTDTADRLMPMFFAGAVTTILDAIRVLDRNLGAIAQHR